MSRRRRSAALPIPGWPWADFTRQWSETLLASAEVIAKRTAWMTGPHARPSTQDLRELAVMGPEKVAAAMAGTNAMAAQWMTTNARLVLLAWQQALAASTAVSSFAGSRSIGQAWSRGPAALRALDAAATAQRRLADATATLATRGLAPVHQRATANARRLRAAGRSRASKRGKASR